MKHLLVTLLKSKGFSKTARYDRKYSANPHETASHHWILAETARSLAGRKSNVVWVGKLAFTALRSRWGDRVCGRHESQRAGASDH
jgi:hypothetical protein